MSTECTDWMGRRHQSSDASSIFSLVVSGMHEPMTEVSAGHLQQALAAVEGRGDNRTQAVGNMDAGKAFRPCLTTIMHRCH